MFYARYEVTPRTGGRWAVDRIGPKGGVKTVEVYRDYDAAMKVCQALNTSQGYVARSAR